MGKSVYTSMEELAKKHREEERRYEEERGITHKQHMQELRGALFWFPLCVVCALALIQSLVKLVRVLFG